jgi:hypothetical protein
MLKNPSKYERETSLIGLPESYGGRIRSFPCRYHSITVLYAYISPRVWAIGSFVAAVQRHSLTPSTWSSRGSLWRLESWVRSPLFSPWKWGGSSTQAWMPTYVSILRIPQMIGLWVWRATVEWYIDRGKPKNSEKTLFQCHFVQTPL